MIFRAIFWIGLVSLLTPHEPNLGLGRPGAGTLQTSAATVLSAASGLSRPGSDCGSACVGGLGLFDRIGLLDRVGFDPDGSVAQGLADVKAQIDAAIAARAQHDQRAS